MFQTRKPPTSILHSKRFQPTESNITPSGAQASCHSLSRSSLSRSRSSVRDISLEQSQKLTKKTWLVNDAHIMMVNDG